MHFQKPMLGVPLDWSNHLNKGCIMHLAMNEGHGDVVRDLSMNVNHGTLSGFAFPPNVASGWNPGQTGIGLNFDGTDDYISCGDRAIFNLSTYSWSMLIKGDSAPGTSKITQPLSNANEQFQFSWDHTNGDFKQCAIHKSGATWYKVQIGSVLSPGVLYCVTATYDGTNLAIYLNGNFENVVPASPPSGAGGALTVNVAATNFKGVIDQVRIHNRTLTAKEVQDYYINPWQVYLDEDDM